MRYFNALYRLIACSGQVVHPMASLKVDPARHGRIITPIEILLVMNKAFAGDLSPEERSRLEAACEEATGRSTGSCMRSTSSRRRRSRSWRELYEVL